MTMKRLNLILFAVCLSFSPLVSALRCGHELVSIGDHKAEVLEKCGEPDYFDSHWERRGNINHADVGNTIPYGYGRHRAYNNFNYGQAYYEEEEVLIEEWTYDFGRRRFYQHLRFENGRLKSVQSGRKGRR